MLFFLNIYSLISWTARLGIFKQRHKFIKSRLARTSREEIPRFRFDFKHATRDIGYHVQGPLVNTFLTEYLEADGYFFIRLLASNASDFVVQEVLEQLWTVYIMKYGENDAQRAEEAFLEFRDSPTFSPSISQNLPRPLPVLDDTSGIPDSKRKYLKQTSNMSVGLLAGTNNVESTFSATGDQNEQV
jgi:hypothetical protein